MTEMDAVNKTHNDKQIRAHTRTDGYYWIKIRDEWKIAEYVQDWKVWMLFSGENIFKDTDFDEIDERKLHRL